MSSTRRDHRVEVPHTRLAADVVRRVAEEFVTRAGTDYGSVEKTLEEKVSDVRRQIERGEAVIVYDAGSETLDVVTRHALREAVVPEASPCDATHGRSSDARGTVSPARRRSDQ